MDVGGEIGIKISEMIAVGLGVNYQNNRLLNSYSDNINAVSDDKNLQILDFTGNISIFIPGVKGLFFGANAGVGFGGYDNIVSIAPYSIDYPDSSFLARTDASGKGFIGGVFVGYELNSSAGPLMFFKFGYRYRNLGWFEGVFKNTEDGISSGTVEDTNGNFVDYDFSGLYFLIGCGFSFGPEVKQ